jgi:flagellar basal-body rod protein FlgG
MRWYGSCFDQVAARDRRLPGDQRPVERKGTGMSGDIYMAAAAALAYEKRLEVIANNLANVNTAGFKRDDVAFQAYLSSADGVATTVAPPYPAPPAGASFWVSYASRTDFSPGPLQATGNRLDLALNGKGFFTVESPDGTVYTRRGNFTLSPDGVLVTQEGWPVQGASGELRLDAGGAGPGGLDVSVGEDGALRLNGRDVGRLRIERFDGANSLAKIGNGYFTASAGAEPAPVEDLRVAQGFLEQSNVEAVRAMTEMIEILRGYESYQRVIRSIDETNAKSINEVGRTS